MKEMTKQIEVSAKLAKTNIDAKKAAITVELQYESWGQIPNLAKLTGQNVNIVIYPSQDEIEFDYED